jgi:hypothetical protein
MFTTKIKKMKATELRIGNWVEIQGLESKIISVDTEGCICENEYCEDFENNNITQNLQPIPLTEEWLERFGCKKQTSSAKGIGEFDWYELPNGMDLVWVLSSKCWVRIETVESVTIKHVHQLQNLYFALTGEELTIDDRD